MMTQTQYAYMVPDGSVHCIAVEGFPEPLHQITLPDGTSVEGVVVGPPSYTHLLEGTAADLELLVVGLVLCTQEWVPTDARRLILSRLGRAISLIACQSVLLARDEVCAALSEVDAAVRHTYSGRDIERASCAWVSALVAVLWSL